MNQVLYFLVRRLFHVVFYTGFHQRCRDRFRVFDVVANSITHVVVLVC